MSTKTDPQVHGLGVDIMTTTVDKAMNWARKNSLWPMPMGISCCAIEMMATVASRYDMARFGAEAMRFSPRQSDMMIVAGTMTNKMAPVVRRIYDQMLEPKYVIAMGTCLCSGGMFDSYSVVQGLNKVIPVDIYLPGCPPRPEALMDALIKLQKGVVERQSFREELRPEFVPEIPLDTIETRMEPSSDGNMILNMGPQHPATHGVLRVVLEMDGETIVRAEPHVGYLHRGFEKIAEEKTWHNYLPYTDRLDYLSPLSNNVAYALALEKLLDLEIPARARQIRVLVSELARISSHLLAIGTNALDLGAATVFFYTFQLREYLYNLFEELTGTRLTTSYTRIGGVARDLPEGWMKRVGDFLEELHRVMDDVEALLNRNRIWLDRNVGVGVISSEMALSYGLTGPNLRASGVAYDMRKAEPYLGYENYDFEIVTADKGDALDRYLVRMAEIRQSARIVEQAIAGMPGGAITSDNRDWVLPEKDLVYSSMEELIHHFKLISEGLKPPTGEVYSAIEAPKGELGFFMVSDGGPNPYRLKIRSPSFHNLQILRNILEGQMMADAVSIIASLDPVMGECDR
ncbi:MAG: NADH dehydrogenase (quinone) subunit D [Candidatus Krumholzibacteria bacterium]|jgi:NADH-quinone oxidoreductase subunit D|nr:NADH dehydrogenase (quinone) subunit D [Candidatus Krumholzibacteria bacterium]MDP6668279.1 NADH dehydrogenase (quinone) subunit D [Candidatus Krumholzibacteria bacterium]MDP6797046.1 NADH dehydrogenase (quinone) subunit D [Candidatus Krumholzibacteria bacterium]MDP7022083.1 NADH dehydrogenase (quinone) subunit D [Candidatus Krumholzibacteria bacterium]